ncbi:Flp family type IVb pilin [Aggregatilinea lenta]|uniref:Flp family type IVb pilin n=1 Tax=Aggregatilinea lenta TaxID=913108 RepID=UPI000E5AB62D|nr:Flp family type IVb pilin [Aggregatilinea lenta]
MKYYWWLRASPAVRRWDEGQGLVEYALILILVAAVVIIGVLAFGSELKDYYDYAIDELKAVMS